jgi:two-component system response regulator FixJ
MPDELQYSAFPSRDLTVHIVDPDLETCETLSVVFRLEGFQTAFSINLRGFLATLERRRPDVVIANFELGGDDGFDLIRRSRTLHLASPIFILQNHPQVGAAVKAVKAGAHDVLTKPIDTEYLIRVVDEALKEEVHIGLLPASGRLIEVRGFGQLTPREREVLQLISNGQSNKEAGRLLGISPRTIEVHRARVMEKLGAKNTADLMRIVLTS